MRVEAGEHAVDRALDQLLVVDLVDVVGADALEDVHEGVEPLVGVGLGRRLAASAPGSRTSRLAVRARRTRVDNIGGSFGRARQYSIGARA